jgi:hypothetical protein
VIGPARVKRLPEDAERPMSVNLTEGIALSHMLARFLGAASRGRVFLPSTSCFAGLLSRT